jgi:hypothetical protein
VVAQKLAGGVARRLEESRLPGREGDVLKRLCIGAAFLAVVGCGGGGGGSDSQGENPPATPTITVGETVVEAGQEGTIHASVGDTLTIEASEVVPGITISPGEGTCSLHFVGGLQTNVDTYTIQIDEGTDECVLKATFDGGEVARLRVVVP